MVDCGVRNVCGANASHYEASAPHNAYSRQEYKPAVIAVFARPIFL